MLFKVKKHISNSLEKSTFESTPQLKELYLSNIGVHIIHENPFVSLKKLVKLDLSQNNIEVLVNHLFLQVSLQLR